MIFLCTYLHTQLLFEEIFLLDTGCKGCKGFKGCKGWS